MYSFDYFRPSSLSEVEGLLTANGDAVPLAGGQTLIPSLKQRLANPGWVIDLKGIGGLVGIERSGDTLVIGALTTHAAVAGSDLVKTAIPALAALAGGIGDPQVRHRGTIGGSIANSDPAADYPAGLVGLAATVTTSRRTIGADDFFISMFQTALEPGEIVVSVAFPIPRRAAYVKFSSPASRYALVGVFVAESANGVRLAVTGAAGHVFRIAAAEAALTESFTPNSLDGITVSPDGLNSDLHADAIYRAHLVTVLARRAVTAAGP